MQNKQKPKTGPLARALRWSDEKSIILTKACTVALLAASAAAMAGGPWIIRWLVAQKQLLLAPAAAVPVLYVLGYACGALALWMLWNLLAFVRRVERGEVFTAVNIAALRRISWCCAVAAVLCLAAGALLYLPFAFLGLAAGFTALIVRVVKNAFEQACRMKSELDLTV